MSGFAEGWKNLMRDPPFESFGFRLATAEDQTVQASLVETPYFLPPTRGRY